MLVVGLIVAAIIVAALWEPIKNMGNKLKYDDTALAKIGGTAAASCQEITTKPADGEQEHLEPNSPIKYEDAPPAFGKHYSTWEPIGKKFYSLKTRPKLGFLVHNLEHGYTILWYDETAAKDDDMMDEIRGIASKFDTNDAEYRNKFKAVPWTKKDGKAFPKGQHIALTHWSVGGVEGAGDPSKKVGVWQYCSKLSGAALETFMKKYPYTDSPEPAAI